MREALDTKANSATLSQAGVLQRKSAGCGNHTVAGGGCSEYSFVRLIPAMAASADVDITGFQGAAVGFLQFLVTDSRMAQYESTVDKSTLLLDYGRCNTTLPCRDVETARPAELPYRPAEIR